MFSVTNHHAPDIVFAPGQRTPRLPADVRAFVERYDRGMKAWWPDEHQVFVGRGRKQPLPLASTRLRQETLIESIKDSNRRHIGVCARIKREGFDSRDPDMADYGRPWSEQLPSVESYNAFSSWERKKTPEMQRYLRFQNRRPDADPGYQGHDFHEDGDRTENAVTGSISPLKMIVAHAPARPKAGPCKDSKMVPMPRRAAFNCRYIEQGRRACYIRLDTDDIWESFDDLRGLLADLQDADEIPVQAQVSVSDRDAEGRIVKPHLLVFTPPGDYVDRKQHKTVALMKAVARGWIRKLREHKIAADPGGMSNFWRGKCALSPYMRTGIINAEHYVSLRDQAAFWTKAGVSMDPFDVASDDWRDIDDDRSPESNAAWSRIRHQVWNVICPRERDGNTERYRSWLGDGGKMKAETMRPDLMAEVLPWAEREFPEMDPRQRYLAVRAACRQCANLWDDTKRTKVVDRGVMTREGMIHRDDDTLPKQREAGKRTRRLQRETSVGAMTEAIGALIAAGVVPSRAEHWKRIAEATGLGRSTIYKWWCDADYAAQTAHDAMRTAAEQAKQPATPITAKLLHHLMKTGAPIYVPESPRWCVGKKEEINSAPVSIYAEPLLATADVIGTTDPDDWSAPFDLAGWLTTHGFDPGNAGVVRQASGTISWAGGTVEHRIASCRSTHHHVHHADD